ncbi:uncharacterized protein B0H64DRAFT_375284 [Chaetomium fimeti]|uniref:Jacalin-type lectin domain-containing protein n=1 Tax=Chaetomium fimeti TaxID=1854472 RepID=A0AAE0HDG7_9PEZI|nr:hypothetical protein B0H64DRAFT_375284 [Chaetomium fimeti]
MHRCLCIAAFVAVTVAVNFLVDLPTALISCHSLRRLRLSPLSLGSLLLCATHFGLSTAASWNPDLFVKPTGVGSAVGGAPFTILGPAGSSVRMLRLYRNNGNIGYLRGAVVVFSDGAEMRAGAHKDQFSFSEFALSSNDLITGMTLWAFLPSWSWSGFFSLGRKAPAARVGRIDVTTSQRSWGFGIDNTAKLSSKAVDVGSGVLVGLQGRAGDGLDQIAPIFLKTLSSSVVDNVVFETPAGTDGLHLVTLKEGSAVWNGTDYSWNFAGTDTRDVSTTFSIGSSTDFSLQTTFMTSLPSVLDLGFSATWGYGTTESHEKSFGRSTELSWSTTISLSADIPAVYCVAMVWEGRVHVRWSGLQTVRADSAAVSFPTSGFLTHVTHGKVETLSSIGRKGVSGIAF